MNKKLVAVIILLTTIVSGLVFLSLHYYLRSKELEKQRPIIITENERRIYSPTFPDTLDFCGERVPLEDFDVRERIEREILVNTYWHSASLLYFKRANRWFPVIEPILKANGIPDDFKFMAVAESGLLNVVSPDGASGFWQFMPAAAKMFGLEISDEVDERYDVEKSTLAACKYLKEAKVKFGNWTLAAASYNYGQNGIENQIGRQRSKNYYNMFLTEETYRFVARIISYKEIFRDPKRYGFYFTDDELYQPIKTRNFLVNYSIKDLAEFAEKNGMSYKILKIFNPWLRNNRLNNRSRKTYSIKIPVESEIKPITE
ncbi:MAG: murein transglycosylase [Ignavibacteriae bacterium HGW-Ignavibacteriae-3]|nr:MAG: murein transglycosylase [Ignavibacteriae bacterium HGW-Ignavibacteriae-3]